MFPGPALALHQGRQLASGFRVASIKGSSHCLLVDLGPSGPQALRWTSQLARSDDKSFPEIPHAPDDHRE